MFQSLIRISRKDLFEDGEPEQEDFDISEIFIPDFEIADDSTECNEYLDENKDKEDREEEELAFPLFGKVSNIVIDEKEPEIQPVERPEAYYIFKSSPEKEKEFESAAVTGEDIIRISAEPLYGMRMPWKVVDFNLEIEKAKRENRKRTRPGKKLRELRRQKPARCNVPGERVYGNSRIYGSSKLQKERWSTKFQRGR